jgi:hypothetical protein
MITSNLIWDIHGDHLGSFVSCWFPHVILDSYQSTGSRDLISHHNLEVYVRRTNHEIMYLFLLCFGERE